MFPIGLILTIHLLQHLRQDQNAHVQTDARTHLGISQLGGMKNSFIQNDHVFVFVLLLLVFMPRAQVGLGKGVLGIASM